MHVLLLLFLLKIPDKRLSTNFFQIIFSVNDTSLFNVNATGWLYPTAQFDREVKGSQVITVYAVDEGTPPKTGSATVRVIIDDVNDHAPTFPDNFEMVLSIHENTTGGVVVGTIKFNDLDAPGPNSELSYNITGGNGSDLFVIDEVTGKLSTASNAKFDHESTKSYTLVIKAADNGEPQLTGNVMFQVNILNIDDLKPTFTLSVYNFEVEENKAVGTEVGQVVAFDQDPLNKVFVYSINLTETSMEAAGNFSLHNGTGVITTLTELNRESHGETFELVVNVRYIDETLPSDSAIVVITVKDVDEVVPVITEFDDITIVENNDVGVVVGSIVAVDSDPDSILSYSLTSPDTVLQANSSTGVITTVKSIDREALPNEISCPGGTPTNTSCFRINGIVQDITGINIFVVKFATLFVQDLDDTPPAFEFPSYSISISETTPVGTELGLGILAEDNDLGIILDYSIEENLDFGIQLRTGIVSVIRELDYETKQNYNLTLTATDSANNVGTSILYITIEDFNDNPPRFTQDSYTASVQEGASVTVFVAQVSAEDIDSPGNNSDFGFSIIEGDPDKYFTIDAKTGIVTVARGDIDRELTPSFDLTILAEDNGSPSMNTTAQLNITVTDIHDEPPVFTQSAFYGEITEGSPSGSPVFVNGTTTPLVISATDPDLNAVVTVTAHGAKPFAVDPSTGAVTLSGEVDYEDEVSYEFSCQAKDEQNEFSGVVPVFITILNIDDNIPQFEQDSYSPSIPEDTEIGEEVVQVVAVDDDEGDTVQYRFESTSELFALNSSTGLVTLKTELDYENKTSHTFVVQASSNDFVGYSSATVTVSVSDVNDESPMFEMAHYTGEIEENKQGSTVLTIKANDVDTATVYYELLEGDISYFTIGETSGVIRAAEDADIDHESFTSLSLTVLAYNEDNSLLNDTVSVTVNVIDVNDETPTFSNDSYTVAVSETLAQNGVATTAVAIDRDSLPQYNTITYSITVAVPDNDEFDINPTTGGIYVKASQLPSAADASQYTLTVRATDGTLSSTATFYLVIVDVNMIPVFTQESYQSTLNEEYALDSVFLTVEATEETDVSDNAVISYSILLPNGYVNNRSECVVLVNRTETIIVLEPSSESGSGSGSGSGDADDIEVVKNVTLVTKEVLDDCSVFPFSINSESGELRLQAELDYETNTTWSFSVVATDSAKVPKSATASVTVTVTDDNDEAPYFTQENYNITALEDLTVGSIVTKVVKAMDPDTVGKLSYYILSGAEGTFVIDTDNGDIELVKALELQVYSVDIQVSDGTVSIDTVLTINVMDVNNNHPVFTMASYEGSFNEDSPVDTSLFKVTATDEDLGMNGRVSYRIVSETNLFAINETSGWIYACGVFDFETLPNVHVLVVEAYDHGIPSNTANVTVTLTELDVNDETPFFDQAEYYVDLPEGTYNNFFLTTVSATDRDSGSNKEIVYILDDEDDFFTIDEEAGIVFVTGEFDYDSVTLEDRVYIVNVTAEDKGDIPLSNYTYLTINITDTNDNAPVFDPVFHRVLIPENTTVNDTAFTVKATDLDSGENARLTYTITSHFPETCNANETYILDPDSGKVTLSSPIDVESQIFNLECNLFIRAVDNGSPQLSADVTYVVVITDINEHPPELVSSTQALVPENSPAGYEFYTINTFDRDPNPLSYSEIGGDISLFTVTNEGKLAVVSNDSLDFDSPPTSYNLTVLITENGKPEMSTIVTIYITVTDENDLPPTFASDEYVTSVRENNRLATYSHT